MNSDVPPKIIQEQEEVKQLIHKGGVANKGARLFIILGSFFLANALIAEFMGVKIFSLEKTFGFQPVSLSLFGQQNLSFNLTAGVLLWPFVFVMTDIINEYFGRRGVRFLSWIAAALIGYAYIMLMLAIRLTPSDFWITRTASSGNSLNMPDAYNAVFGQGTGIMIGSLTAFLIGQVIDVTIFYWIKKRFGERYLWLRATGSTFVSQLIDSFVVLFIAFYIFGPSNGIHWPLSLVMAIGVVNYIYKFVMAIVLTPVIYLVHAWVEKFLGRQLAEEMKEEAMRE